MASGFWGVTGFFIVLEVAFTLGVVFTGKKKEENTYDPLLSSLCSTD